MAAPTDPLPATATPSAGPVPPAGPAPPAAPKPPGRLTLIGAGHVFDIEATIRGAIQALRPDIVFLELDKGRFDALMERARTGSLPERGGGLVHRKLAKFQEDMAGLYGATVGGEMLAGVRGASDVGAQLALVDDPADRMLRRVLRELTWRERLRAAGMVVGGGLKSLWPPARRRGREAIEAELRKYQDDPAAMLADLQRKFPTLHRILIAERDAKMARRIRLHLAGRRHGVAVLGDGHVNGMQELLKDLQPTVYRLGQVRAGRLPKPVPVPVATGTPSSVGFTVEWRPGTKGQPPQP